MSGHAGSGMITRKIRKIPPGAGFRPILACVLAALSAAVATPEAHAQGCISRQAAIDVLENEVIRPRSLNHDLIAFALKRPLKRSDRLQPYLPHPLPPGVAKAPWPAPESVAPLGRRAWFFWIDDQPLARYGHPTRFVLIDCAYGAAQVTEERWWPVLNGRSRWADKSEYWNRENWAFSRLRSIKQPRQRSGLSLPTVATVAPRLIATAAAAEAETECIIAVNGWAEGQSGGPDFAIDAAGVAKNLGKATKGLVIELKPPDNGKKAFFAAVTRAADIKDCDDVVIYIAAHGPGQGVPSIMLGTDILYAYELARLLAKHPRTTFKLVFDSGYGGAFATPMNLPNVALVITAAGEMESAYGDLDLEGDPNPDDRGGEFSSGLVADIRLARKDPEIRARLRREAKRNGTSFTVALLNWAYRSAWEMDVARLRGWTHPTNTQPPAHTRRVKLAGRVSYDADPLCRGCRLPSGPDGLSFDIATQVTRPFPNEPRPADGGARGQGDVDYAWGWTPAVTDANGNFLVDLGHRPEWVTIERLRSSNIPIFEDSCRQAFCAADGGRTPTEFSLDIDLPLSAQVGDNDRLPSLNIRARCACRTLAALPPAESAGPRPRVAPLPGVTGRPFPAPGPTVTRSPDIDNCARTLAWMTGGEHRREGRLLSIPSGERAAFTRYDLEVYRNSTDPSVTPRHKACAASLLDFLGRAGPSDRRWLVDLYVGTYAAAAL